MVSKLEALRKGRSVDMGEGVTARLNPKNKTMEYSSGKVVDIGENSNYFPKNKAEERASLETQKRERSLKTHPLGETAGKFIHQTLQKGAVTGGLGDLFSRLTNSGEDYLAKREAKRRVTERIDEENPGLSMAARAASFVPDIIATKGMSGPAAGATLAGVGSGSRALDDPGEVLGSMALGAAGGKVLDLGSKFIAKTAARRGLSREVAQKTLAAEREMQQAKTAYTQAKSADTVKKASLKKDYLSKKSIYDKDLASLDPRQKVAQQEFSANINKELDSVEKTFPKGTKIPMKDLEAWEFYHQYIQENGLVGSKEAVKMEKLIKELFHKETTAGAASVKSPKQFVDSLRGIEGAAVTGSNLERQFLGQLKEHLGEKTTQIVNDSVLSNEFRSGISKTLRNDLSESLMGVRNAKKLVSEGETAVNGYFNELSSSELAQKVNTPGFAQEIAENTITPEQFVSSKFDPVTLEKIKKQWPTLNLGEQAATSPEYDRFIKMFSEKIENNVASAKLQMNETVTHASGDVAENLRRTYGMSEPIEAPIQPEAPVYDAPPTMGEVAPPPEMLPAEGMAEGMGDMLEKPIGNIFKGKGPMGTGPIGSIAALKYLATPKTAVAAGAYAGLKGLTSPTAGGAAARATFEAMGIGVVDYMAQRYPSYNNGTLDDPMERRSLVKEIENDESMPLNTQALTQSQVNRGKSIKTEGLDR